MREERGPWYLLTGFLIGVVLGVVYAWVISPVQYVDTSPASLRAGFKDQYRALIAAAYLANGDLARAEARLNLLGDGDIARALTEQAQRTMAEGNDPLQAQALGLLAVRLGQGPELVSPEPSPTDQSPSPTVPAVTALPAASGTPAEELTVSPQETGDQAPETPGTPGAPTTGLPAATETPGGPTATSTRTPLPTGTPLPTRTPTPTPGAPFVFQDSSFLCDQDLNQPLIQILAEDASGAGVPGVEIITSWSAGENSFFTGLKPELSPGYADFTMTPGEVYSVRLAAGGLPVTDLTPGECEAADGSRYWGSWLLVFSRP